METNKMTYEQVKSHYLNDQFEFALATEEQVDRLSRWLDANGKHNWAHMRWEDYQEELRCMAAEFD